MREIKSYQELLAWRKTFQQGEHVIYCDGGTVLDRDIAIERAILEATDFKVDHSKGATVLTAKGRRGRGKGGRPHHSSYSHVVSAASVGAQHGGAWVVAKDKELGRKKAMRVRKALLREANDPCNGPVRADNHIIDKYFRQ